MIDYIINNTPKVVNDNPYVIISSIALTVFGIGYSIGHWTANVTSAGGKKYSKLKENFVTVQKKLENCNKETTSLKGEVASGKSQLRRYARLKDSLLGKESDLWNLHEPKPFENYDRLILSNRPHVISVVNLKGGVGKTTIATNLAAFYAKYYNKKVLLVDLDFQGSATLATLNLTTDGVPDFPANVGRLFDGSGSVPHVQDVIQPVISPLVSNISLAPCSYNFAKLENQRLVSWLMDEEASDPRYILPKFLFSGAAFGQFDIVIIDAPPRLSMGAINALNASRSIVIPTSVDKLSINGVHSFLSTISLFTKTMNPSLMNAFIAINRSDTADLSRTYEQLAVQELTDVIRDKWEGKGRVMKTAIPRRAAFANALEERSLPLFYNDGANPKTKEILQSFGKELAEQLGIDVD